MPRYDHRHLLFASHPVVDEQVSLLVQVEKKLARGKEEGGHDVMWCFCSCVFITHHPSLTTNHSLLTHLTT
jgi:hypothetical protein